MKKCTALLLLISLFGSFLPIFDQVAEARGRIVRISRSPHRDVYDIDDVLMVECEMDVDGTTRWVVLNRSTGQSWIKHEHGAKYNQERLVLSELVTHASGRQTLKVTCEGRYGDGGWEDSNVARAFMEFQVDTGQPGDPAPQLTSGGMNIQGFCQHLGFDRAGLGNQRNARSWRCVDGPREERVDFNALCAWQYGGQLPYPGLDDPYNPYDWACYAQPHQQAQMPQAPPPAAPPTQENPPAQQPPAQQAPAAQPPQQNPPSSGSGGSQRGTSLQPGDHVYVQYSPVHDKVRCRSGAGTGYGEIFQLNQGQTGLVVGGPVVAGGYTWIQAEFSGTRCWAAVGDSQRAWLVETSQPSAPASNPPPAASGGSGGSGEPAACQAVAPLRVGRRGQATVSPSSDPINIRSGAGTQNSRVGTLNQGEIFDVIGGPRCVGSYRWWQIRRNSGQTGWIADGDSQRYWVQDAGGASAPATSGEWCSARPSEVANLGWSREGHLYPNPKLEIHFPAQVNFDGVSEYYMYYRDEWAGHRVVGFEGWGSGRQTWQFGISSTWYVWSQARSALQEEVLDPAHWRLDYYREDGACFYN